MRKNERLITLIGGVDQKYVIEAENKIKLKRKKRSERLKGLAIAASVAIVISAVSAWLFIPFSTTPKSVAAYKDSEYYELIEKINDFTFSVPEHKNNFEKLLASILSIGKNSGGDGFGGAEMEMGGASSGTGSANSYQEITDNQVAGVVEADRIKRTDSHIFYFDESTLYAYSIDGLNSALVGKYDVRSSSLIFARSSDYNNFGNSINWEFFLTDDGKSAVVITDGFIDGRPVVSVQSLDVSDPSSINQSGETVIDGIYKTSRMVNGTFIIATQYYIGNYSFSNPESFVPTVNTDGSKTCVPMENILVPERLNSRSYMVVSSFSGEDMSLIDTGAFLSYSNDVYISETSIYAIRGYSVKNTVGDVTSVEQRTEISRMSYSEQGFTVEQGFDVSGSVLNRFSIDEHEGMLRAVTSISISSYKEFSYGIGADATVGSQGLGSTISASLYVYDISTGELVGSVERFAPKGETVRSARFHGDTAYVCTSIMMTDPVFVFDLSDLSNVTYKDTGVITGFSSSLIRYGDLLLGVGLDDWSTVKVEIYKETETGVVSIAKYKVPYADYSTEYKSYFIDRENMLFGVPINRYGDRSDYRYVLLGISENGITELASVRTAGNLTSRRGVCIDGVLYVFGADEFEAVQIGE